MNKEEVFFDTYYHQNPEAYESNEGQRRIAKFYLGRLLQNLKPIIDLGEARVLSLGCGTGRFEIELAPLVKEITGVDVSAEGIRIASKKNKFRNLTFLTASATDLPFSPESFDLVLSLSLIHHIKDRKRLIKEIRRVIKGGGYFYAIEPHKNGVAALLGSAFLPSVYHKIHSPDEEALVIKPLIEELKGGGFGEIKIQFCDFFYGPLTFLFEKLPRFFLDFMFRVNMFLISCPFINNLSGEFNLLAHKPKVKP